MSEPFRNERDAAMERVARLEEENHALKAKLDAQQRQQQEAAEVAAGLAAADAQLNANRPEDALAGLRPLASSYSSLPSW